MLVYITGVPGSGKTYKAVKEIYDHFGIDSPKKDDRFLYCYTNINQFDFSKVDERVRRLDFDDLKSKLIQLHSLYKKKVTDEELNKKAKEFEIYKALFVIDEAHNYFQVRDPVLIWWLTYHRHMYQDIYLITQNLALIESKYKPLAEYFYKAVPSSLRFNKKVFKYNVFVDSRMSQKSKAQVEKIKFNPNVIELYHSGDTVKSPNFILRILTVVAILSVFVGILFYYIYSSFLSSSKDSSSSVPTVKQKSVPVVHSSETSHSVTFEDYTFLIISCYSDDCRYLDYHIPFTILNSLVDLSESKFVGTNVYRGSARVDIYLLASPSFIKFFQGVPNEKNSPLSSNFRLFDRK